jgi:hypothetical protein
MTHHDSESFDDAASLQIAHLVEDGFFVGSKALGNGREGARCECDPVLKTTDDTLGQVCHRGNPKSM